MIFEENRVRETGLGCELHITIVAMLSDILTTFG